MKKLLLFTVTIFLMVAMMGCPSRVNRGPAFIRIIDVNEEEEILRLQTLTLNTYTTDKNAFQANPDNAGKTFDYKTAYGDQYIIYEHTQGDDFHPAEMVNDLIQIQNVLAIDYIQDYVEVGANRDYEDISDSISVTSFYDIWTDGEDANFDGDVNSEDEEFYGQIKTDQDGNYVYDSDKIMLLEFLPRGEVMEFTLYVEDADGASASVSGLIIIVN